MKGIIYADVMARECQVVMPWLIKRLVFIQ